MKTLIPKSSPFWWLSGFGSGGEVPKSTPKSVPSHEYQGMSQPIRSLNFWSFGRDARETAANEVSRALRCCSGASWSMTIEQPLQPSSSLGPNMKW